ncbi:PRC-barrel domain-containing protein [Thalassococcus sp. CAU 1522]|uniref:PRC-barrel domain-containing protein n=1 Tax=Thalassococcus arenae TaxID=2851652 RepID=A0ABS6N2Z8_9RHOB|nr:PRC-barrel domain-containing protein [Thalassococcus arenae]MBV2358388.1 PRC-barrel domain-containing protein [Thalassococcus arenae]
MKFLTSTTLCVLLVSTAALADSHAATTMTETADKSEMSMDGADLIRTRDITGGTIYTIAAVDDAGWEMDWAFADMQDNLTEIGEIEDIVLSRSGEFKGIVAEIGGFLDIGDKHVMLPVGDVKLVAVDDTTYAYVTRLSEEQLEQMESVDEGFWN